MKIIIHAAMLMLALPLAGCSYFNSDTHLHGQDSNYMAARSIPPLKIPPGVSSSAFHNEYPVSDRAYPPSSLKVNTVPPGL